MVRVIIVEGTLDDVLTVIQKMTREGFPAVPGDEPVETGEADNKNGDGGETRGGVALVPLPLSLAAERLTPREQEILAALMAGGSNKQIARRLHIGEPAVKQHVHHLLRKLGVVNRTQAAIWGRANIQMEERVVALLPPPVIEASPVAAVG